MKILYHHRTQGRGVEGVHIRGMVEAFRRLGHDVIVVSPPGVDPLAESKNSSWKRFAKNAPEAIFELSELLYNFWAYRKMSAIVKSREIDFIYERYALNTFAGLNISRRYDIPIILEVNDAAGIERVRKLKVHNVARRIEKYVFGGAAAIVTISSHFKKIIVDGGIAENKVFVIPNAIDESKAYSDSTENSVRERYSLNGQTVIGYVGSFLEWHGVDLLLESFKSSLDKRRDSKLLLVGGGITLDDAKSFVRTNDLKEHVVFTGNVPHNEVPSYIRAMDICVIPDSNDYGSPMKLFEYMGAGKPIVAPRLSPMEDVIKSGENGILFKRGDKDGLNDALDTLIADKNMRDRIGRLARDIVLKNHTWTKNAEKVLEIVKRKQWN